MRSKALKVVLIILLILVVVSPLLYFWWGKSEVLYVTTERELKVGELMWTFAKEGWVFRRLLLPPNELLNQERLQLLIKKGMRSNTHLVVCSPLVSYALDGVPLAFSNSVSFGEYPNFESQLVKPSVDRGWQKAGEGAQSLASQTPLPTLLLYNGTNAQATQNAHLFSDNFRGLLLDTIVVEEEGRRKMEEIALTIEEHLTLLVVVPHLDDLAYLLGAQPFEGVRWIVDERYEAMVKKGALEGVVYSDLYQSLLPLLDGERGVFPIIRDYRPSKTKLKSFSL
ncbi:MAG: hypothetical protein GX842_08850 [Spirochaetales bacterium]|nr:hypothetical protein [Spirochaetales bacterium]